MCRRSARRPGARCTLARGAARGGARAALFNDPQIDEKGQAAVRGFESDAARLREQATVAPEQWAKFRPADWQAFDSAEAATRSAFSFGPWTSRQLETLSEDVEAVKVRMGASELEGFLRAREHHSE